MSKLPLQFRLVVGTIGLIYATLPALSAIAHPVEIYYPIHRYPVYPNYGNWIYGSPIPAPIPVNPVSGSAVTPQLFNIYTIKKPSHHREYRRDRPIVYPSQLGSPGANFILVNPVPVHPEEDRPVYLRESGGYGQGYWKY